MSTSQSVHVGNRKLLPVKEVLGLVSYSRDYITRLAREGKIVAVQIDRQWLVDPESLQNFYEHAQLEESVRSQVLSEERKREREVREFVMEGNAHFEKKVRGARQSAKLESVVLLVLSVCSWSLVVTFFSVNDVEKIAQMALVGVAETVDQSRDLIMSTESDQVTLVSSAMGDVAIIEETESFTVSEGIVLFPLASGTPAVAAAFSDPIIVEHTGISSGTIRMIDGRDVVVPFVTVPVAPVEVSVVKKTP
jgi:hypothetical protein